MIVIYQSFFIGFVCHFLQIRTVGVTIISIVLSIAAFVSLKLFPILLDTQDVHGCLSLYGCGCVIGAIFVLFAMKETNGKPLDDDDDDDGVSDEPEEKNKV